MSRIVILVLTLFWIVVGGAQNLILNGGFEVVKKSDGKPDFYLHNFYCEDWIEPTDCTTDIFRDSSACSDAFVKNIEYRLDNCISTKSGNYSIGFVALGFDGAMEHVTGKLKKPLQEGKVYKVSFYLKYFGCTTYLSKGIGYKFSKDSIVFDSDILFTHKLSPFYQDLFENRKIYADFEIKDYVTNKNWVKFSSTYIAKGGEKYLTFGQFSFRNDKKIMKQLSRLRHNATDEKLQDFIKSGKSEYLKYFKDLNVDRNCSVGENCYLLDEVEVVELGEDEESAFFLNDCSFCVDTDPMTIIPQKREVEIGKNFVGDIRMELGIRLKPLEKYVLQYGKRQIIFINTEQRDASMVYEFRYPARKLRKKPIQFYVEKISLSEVQNLQKNTKNIKAVEFQGFKGLMITKKKCSDK